MSLPAPNPHIQTSFVLGSDGTTYINIRGQKARTFAERQIFVGYALTRREVEQLGSHALHSWAAIALLGWGSDGRVYVDEARLSSTSGRRVFRGFAASTLEAAWLTYTLHMTASSIVSDARHFMRKSEG